MPSCVICGLNDVCLFIKSNIELGIDHLPVCAPVLCTVCMPECDLCVCVVCACACVMCASVCDVCLCLHGLYECLRRRALCKVVCKVFRTLLLEYRTKGVARYTIGMMCTYCPCGVCVCVCQVPDLGGGNRGGCPGPTAF